MSNVEWAADFLLTFSGVAALGSFLTYRYSVWLDKRAAARRRATYEPHPAPPSRVMVIRYPGR